MIPLLLSILSSTSIYIVFKLVGRYKVHSFSPIIVNYLVACLAGFFLCESNPFSLSIASEKWFPIAPLIGVLFIVMFYLIGTSTMKAGVTITTVAVKMSVVFPIAFSLFYDASDRLTLLKAIGILLAIFSVILTIYRVNRREVDWRVVFLPLVLFVGMGIVDSFVKYAQAKYISNELTPVFSFTVFAFALASGLAVLPFNKEAMKGLISPKAWLLGALLGLVNFGSMYFLILALNHTDTTTGLQAMGSVVFGINNIGIVALSVLVGLFLFSERPTRTNWVGIALSVVAIILLSVSGYAGID